MRLRRALRTPKGMTPEILLGLDFICRNLDFILGGVSSHKIVSRGVPRYALILKSFGPYYNLNGSFTHVLFCKIIY